jgi:hypothetical protein
MSVVQAAVGCLVVVGTAARIVLEPCGLGEAAVVGEGALEEGTAIGVGECTLPEEGVYVIRGSEGTYVGQSDNISARLAQHVASGRFTQAEVDAAERLAVSGGKTAREIAEQQKIDELGGIGRLLNRRNPIGRARFNLMPRGYMRP